MQPARLVVDAPGDRGSIALNTSVSAAVATAATLVGLALRPSAVRSPTAPPPGKQRRSTSRRRRERTIVATLPDAIDLVVLAVHSGHLPVVALREVAPFVHPCISEAFAAVLQQVDDGQRFADALQTLPQHLGSRAVPLADSFAAADRDGLPLAPVLERLAGEARQQRRRRADELARQLPIRLAIPLVLCTLPSFVLLTVAPLMLAALTSLTR